MKRWQIRFFIAHRSRHPNQGLPATDDQIYGAPLYKAIADQIDTLAIDEDAATLASERLVSKPARYPSQHWETFIDYAQEAMAARPRDVSSREGAQEASRFCAHCSGNGFVTVWHPRPELREKLPLSVSAYCVCAYGRWIQSNHAARSPDAAKCTPDLRDVIKGRSFWLVERPGMQAPTL